jgi:hypothetical protein
MDINGHLKMWGGESYPRMIVHDIEQGAALTVAEGETIGPRFARYQPHPNVLARLKAREGIAT